MQKTAYEMRISDWSSDVCSSDLAFDTEQPGNPPPAAGQFELDALMIVQVFKGLRRAGLAQVIRGRDHHQFRVFQQPGDHRGVWLGPHPDRQVIDRKSTRLNSSH